MQVTEIEGERLAYRVSSETKPDTEYYVNLIERAPVGYCTCTAYSTQSWPKRYSCKHITAAKTYFINQLLTRLSHDLSSNHKGESPNLPRSAQEKRDLSHGWDEGEA